MIKKIKVKYDYILLLQPTSPLRTSNDIDNSIKKIINNNFESLISISKNKKRNKFIVNINKNNTIKFKDEKNKNGFYYLNGAIFIAKRNFIINKKNFMDKKRVFI